MAQGTGFTQQQDKQEQQRKAGRDRDSGITQLRKRSRGPNNQVASGLRTPLQCCYQTASHPTR